ncbi:MAG TPA: hypothetical protein VJY35_03775 [Candidatus Eisenbacteria bacterium]|nr:hypothetical protein [Candidatus Eisenbacteria bacterium]
MERITPIDEDRSALILRALRKKITPEQEELLRRLWEGGDFRSWTTAKSLFHKLPVASSRRALEDLGGSIVAETTGGIDETYVLRLLGAIVSQRGVEFEKLLARFLAYEVKRYDEDSNVKDITKAEVERDLHLTEPDLSDLYRLVTMPGAWLCNGSSGPPDWRFGVLKNVHDLTEVQDWHRFVREHALSDYDPSLPVRAAARESFDARRPLDRPAPSPVHSVTMSEERPEPFSRRHGYTVPAAEIIIREDAPPTLRNAVLYIAEEVGLDSGDLRSVVCRALNRAPDVANNWSYPNVMHEVRGLIKACPWFRVYDIIEKIFALLWQRDPQKAVDFQQRVNSFFIEEGIGWQLAEGVIETRGPEAFEAGVQEAREVLDSAGLAVASNEVHEALHDLSRRPEPDITGAIQHSMAALEAVARRACGDERATLGDILKRHEGLLPRPLDAAVEKVWGYASEMGRHLREGRAPGRDEAELVVGVVAAASTYLVRRLDGHGR